MTEPFDPAERLREMRERNRGDISCDANCGHADARKLIAYAEAVLAIHKPDALNECPVCIATWDNGDYKYGGAKGWVAENYPCPTAKLSELLKGKGK